MIYKVEDLEVYQLAKNLYPEIVAITRKFSFKSNYLRDQICRATNSISANIAEGYGRSIIEFKRYLTTAIGSENEIKSHLENAYAIKEITKEELEYFLSKINILGKKLFTLRKNWH